MADIATDETMTVEEAADDAAEPRLYEVGYHLASTLSDEEVTATAARITAALTTAGGELVHTAAPVRIDLAYPIEQRSAHGGQKKVFQQAYFGWCAVACEPTAIEAVAEQLAEETDIIRFLVTHTNNTEIERAQSRGDAMPYMPADTSADAAAEEDDAETAAATTDIDRAVDELTASTQ